MNFLFSLICFIWWHFLRITPFYFPFSYFIPSSCNEMMAFHSYCFNIFMHGLPVCREKCEFAIFCAAPFQKSVYIAAKNSSRNVICQWCNPVSFPPQMIVNGSVHKQWTGQCNLEHSKFELLLCMLLLPKPILFKIKQIIWNTNI